MDRKLVVIAVLLAAALAAAAVFVIHDDGPDVGHRLHYDGNGGECSISDGNVYDDGDVAEVCFSPVPVKLGYIFVGWSEVKGSDVVDYNAGFENNHVHFEGSDVTLYAVYMHDKTYLQEGSELVMEPTLELQGYPDAVVEGSIHSYVSDYGEYGASFEHDIDFEIRSGDTVLVSYDLDIVHKSGEFYEPWGVPVEYELLDYTFGGKTFHAVKILYIMEEYPMTYIWVTYGIGDGVPYEALIEHTPEDYLSGMKLYFKQTACKYSYAEPEDDGGYVVTYDGNGGCCALGDGRTHQAGEKLNVKFSPMPLKLGYTFCGWSEDRDATIPDYDLILGKHVLEVKGDTTLYAVYVPDQFCMLPGSSFSYDLESVFPDTPGLKYSETHTQTLEDISDGVSIYHVVGEYRLTDSGKVLDSGYINYTYDANELWDGEVADITTTQGEYVYKGVTVPVYINEYTYSDGSHAKDYVNVYSGLAYETVSEFVDDTYGHTVSVSRLTDYNMVV